MAQYIVPQGEFIDIAETSGTIQNDSAVVVEITNKKEANTGIRLYPQESKSFDPMPKYARAIGGKGPGVLHVVDFMETVPDGDSGEVDPDQIATDEEFNEMMDDVFGPETTNAGAAEGNASGDGADLDG